MTDGQSGSGNWISSDNSISTILLSKMEDNDGAQSPAPTTWEDKLAMLEDLAEQGNVEAMNMLGQFYLSGMGGTTIDVDRGLYFMDSAASNGHVKSIMFLAATYLSGEHGLPCDPVRSMSYFAQAADLGQVVAMYFLAQSYEQLGDSVKALYYYEKAASVGDLDSMFSAGSMYFNGRSSIPVDKVKAIQYFTQAAEQGHPQGMYNLGVALLEQQDKDLIHRAVEYLQRAAEGAVNEALYNLAVIYHNGHSITLGVEDGIVEMVIEADIYRAIDYYKQAGAGGSSEAYYALGMIYYRGEHSVPVDILQAIHFYTLATETGKGHGKAACNLGASYFSGEGDVFPMDIEKAIKYFELSIEQGVPQAMFNLGNLYQSKDIRMIKYRDLHKAAQYFERAIAAGQHSQAMLNLAIILFNGNEAVPVDREKGLQLYHMAAEKGDERACYSLGVIYANGLEGVPIDREQAIIFLKKAAALNYGPSLHKLGEIYQQMADDQIADDKSCESLILEAVKYYQEGGEKGDNDGYFALGVIYSSGQYKKMNDGEKAIQCYECAAKGGHGRAAVNLGLMHLHGLADTPKDINKAIEWFETAAKYEDKAAQVSAMYNLGVLYHSGYSIDGVRVVDTDTSKAISYYQHGFEAGKQSSSKNNGDWTGCWCAARLGLIYIAQGRLEEAKTLYQGLVDSEFYMGYVGLAETETIEEGKIDYLIKAADKGIAEAWTMLVKYVDSEYLRQQWPVDKIALLKSLADAFAIRSEQLMEIVPRCEPLPTCAICCQEKSLKLLQGPNKELKGLPCSHIDCALFDINGGNIDNIALTDGGQGDVVFTSMRVNDGNMMQVALKRYKQRADGDLMSMYNLSGELHHLLSLQGCPNVVQCFGHTMLSDDAYVVLESAKYEDLRKLRSKPIINELFLSGSMMSLGLLVQWMYEVAIALEYMHRMCIEHSDIKPHNILVFDGLHVKLTDMGLSRKATAKQQLGTVSKEDEELHLSHTSCLTSVHGYTLEYASLEVRLGIGSTVQSDMFSFGMTFVHLINGNPLGPLFQVECHSAIRRLTELYQNNVAVQLSRLIESCCLSVKPDDRMTSRQCVEQLLHMKNTVALDAEELNQLCEQLY